MRYTNSKINPNRFQALNEVSFLTRTLIFLLPFNFLLQTSFSQPYRYTGSNHGTRFEQLDYLLPSPNEFRKADGAPGPRYWQQRADYDIEAVLDEKKLRLTGKETVTYHNNSPSPLSYIWLQLDENQHDPNSDNHQFDESRF